MQKREILIGLLPSITRNDMLYNLLYDIGDVEYITPTTKSSKYEIIVLPDNMGIYPNLQCFTIGQTTRIPTAAIDPTIEVFRVHSLPYYLEQGIPIIGLGDNACLLYNELGGKVAVTSLGNQLVNILEDRHVIGKVDRFINGFKYNNTIGLVNYKGLLTQILYKLALEIIAEINNEIDNINTEENVVITPSKPINPISGGRSRSYSNS